MLGFSDDFEKSVNELDTDYVDHLGLENVVRQMIESNLEAFGDESMNQGELLEAIGFSATGIADLSHFIDPQVTHFTLSNWINLYLDKLFRPTTGVITASNFPFQEETFNEVFSHQQNYQAEADSSKALRMINFTSKQAADDWIKTMTDPNTVARHLEQGETI